MKSIIAGIMAAFAAQFLLCSCFVEKTVPPRENAECRATANVASFNMLYFADKPYWEKRRAQIPALMKYHEFDICGSQELSIEQAEWILSQLGSAWAAEFNNPKIEPNGKSWAMNVVIFYKASRFERLDGGTFWFGPNPYPPEKRTVGWGVGGEKQNRFCAWIKLRDKLSGREFVFFDLHLNSRNKPDREKSFDLLVSEVPKIAGKTPFVIVGDFNTREKEMIDKFESSGLLRNSRDISQTPHYGPESTYIGVKPDPKRWLSRPIDFVFVSNGMEVLKHAHISDTFEDVRPSDHMPVLAKIVLPATR